jgi:hypothetical protein
MPSFTATAQSAIAVVLLFLLAFPAACKLSNRSSQPVWHDVLSTDGRYGADFPGKEEVSVTSWEWNGVHVKTHQLKVELAQGSYIVRYTDFPISPDTWSDPSQAYDYQRDKAVSLTNGVLMSERDLSLEGKLGREFTVRLETGQIDIYRFFLVGSRLYQVNASLNSRFTDDKQAQAIADRFLDSFRIVEG